MKRKILTTLLIGTLCLSMLSGCGSSAGSTSDNTASIANNSSSSKELPLPSDLGISWQDNYEYKYLGLNLKLSEALKPLMENKDVMMSSTEEYNNTYTKLKYAYLSWNSLTEEQKTETLNDYQKEYGAWLDKLQRIGTIGVYHKDVVKKLDEITKCSSHTELGQSADGEYVYYLSTNPSADSKLTEALTDSEVSITDMVPLQEDASVFDAPRVDATNVGTFQTTDINGNACDQEIFKGYDLTLVNIFATWCSPCVNELPELEKIYQELGKKYNINVVGIVMDTVDENFDPAADQDEVIDKAKKLVEKAGVSYPLIIPDKTALNGRLIGINAYPETFFVDKNGNIVGGTYSGSGSYDDWAEVVETELENLKKGTE